MTDELSAMGKLMKAFELSLMARTGIELTYFDVIALVGHIKALEEDCAITQFNYHNLKSKNAELEAQLADVKAKRDTLMGCFFEYEAVAPNGELMASVLDMHKRILELETQVKERDALIDRLVEAGDKVSDEYIELYGWSNAISNKWDSTVQEWQVMKGDTHD